MNHIDRFLKLASEYEAEGNKEKAEHFLALANKFENCMKRIKHIETEIKTNPNRK